VGICCMPTWLPSCDCARPRLPPPQRSSKSHR
jgi:hypothetical protein